MNVKEKTINYFKGDEMAADVFLSKYSYKGEETPEDVWRRMAREFARIELVYQKEENLIDNSSSYSMLSDYGKNRGDLTEEKIYRLFSGFGKILPQGSILASLGTDSISSLSNCMVIGQVPDSYGGICMKDEEMAQLYKRRCGVGVDISTLRPRGTDTNNAASTSTGAVSFMERFSNTTREVAQEGRRGALMQTIDIRHPDVLEFINIKQDNTKVTGANISVRIRDDFMEAVENDKDYILRFPIDAPVVDDAYRIPYDITEKAFSAFIRDDKHTTDVYYRRVKAKDYWEAICKAAWKSAEPGIMFVDRHWDYSPDSVYERFRGVTTNPLTI